jgi:hypothetical protein
MASADGYFYMFDVNTQEGGICKLLTQASLYTLNTNIFNATATTPNQLLPATQQNGKDQLLLQQQQQQQFLHQNNNPFLQQQQQIDNPNAFSNNNNNDNSEFHAQLMAQQSHQPSSQFMNHNSNFISAGNPNAYQENNE